MTTLTATSTRSPILPTLAAAFVGTAGFTSLGTVLGAQSDEHGWGEYAFVCGVALVVAVGVGFLVSRVEGTPRAGGIGLVLSVAGLITSVAFYLGLTPALAAGGLLLGAAARRQGQAAGMGIAATAIGALAIVGYVAIYLGDYLA